MNPIFFATPIAIVAVASLLGPMAARVPVRRYRNEVQLALNRAVDGRQADSTEADQAAICVLCGYRVVDDVAHWKAIHHVPA